MGDFKTPEICFRLEFAFYDSALDMDEITQRVQRYLVDPQSSGVSNIVIDLLCATGARTWELGQVELVVKLEKALKIQ